MGQSFPVSASRLALQVVTYVTSAGASSRASSSPYRWWATRTTAGGSALSSRAFPTGTDQLRQWRSICRLVESVEASTRWAALLVVGSFATGQADAMSDVDAFILVEPGTFSGGWDHRHELHGESIVACWDTSLGGAAFGGHKWLTSDLTYFDCAVAEPQAVKVTGPFLLAAGQEELAARVEVDPGSGKQDPVWPIEGTKPIPVAYAELKLAVRASLGVLDT